MPKQKHLILDEIMEIKEIGELDTYDFNIPDTHCYIANGILVHNSADIAGDADIILLLTREKKKSMSGEDTEGVFEPRCLVTAAKVRYAAGGSTYLWVDDAKCLFSET